MSTNPEPTPAVAAAAVPPVLFVYGLEQSQANPAPVTGTATAEWGRPGYDRRQLRRGAILPEFKVVGFEVVPTPTRASQFQRPFAQALREALPASAWAADAVTLIGVRVICIEPFTVGSCPGVRGLARFAIISVLTATDPAGARSLAQTEDWRELRLEPDTAPSWHAFAEPWHVAETEEQHRGHLQPPAPVRTTQPNDDKRRAGAVVRLTAAAAELHRLGVPVGCATLFGSSNTEPLSYRVSVRFSSLDCPSDRFLDPVLQSLPLESTHVFPGVSPDGVGDGGA